MDGQVHHPILWRGIRRECWTLMRNLISCIICDARPRSSMDRVTDFESGGCAFDPRRGRYFYGNFPIRTAIHQNALRASRANFRRFGLGASRQRGEGILALPAGSGGYTRSNGSNHSIKYDHNSPAHPFTGSKTRLKNIYSQLFQGDVAYGS